MEIGCLSVTHAEYRIQIYLGGTYAHNATHHYHPHNHSQMSHITGAEHLFHIHISGTS